MQIGEIVGFDDYTDYRTSTKRNVKSKKVLRKKKRQHIKNNAMLVAAVGFFFLIVCVGADMRRYIVRNSDSLMSFGDYIDVPEGGIKQSGLTKLSFSLFKDKGDEAGRVYDGDWKLILVNKNNPVPDGYDVELTTLSNGVQVDSRIYPDLQNMFDDMRAEGVYPVVGEGYRTYEEQEKMMQDKIDAYRAEGHSKAVAKKLAKKWVAKPGTSEHELGIALDINAAEEMGSDNEDVYEWLYNNAYKYGFILRYPQDKEDITGIDYEPWHYRYVGKEAAAQMYECGLTLEEYVN